MFFIHSLSIKPEPLFNYLVKTVRTIVLALAQKTLPLGTSYAIWTGIGAVGAAICGMILFNEPRDVARILCILLIVAGILGLKFTSGH